MLNAPVNPTTGHLFFPSHQLCATWVVSAWERVPEALVRKAWTVGNYKTFNELQKSPRKKLSEHDIIIYNQNNIINIITELENSADLIQHYLAADNVCANSEFDNNNIIE